MLSITKCSSEKIDDMNNEYLIDVLCIVLMSSTPIKLNVIYLLYVRCFYATSGDLLDSTMLNFFCLYGSIIKFSQAVYLLCHLFFMQMDLVDLFKRNSNELFLLASRPFFYIHRMRTTQMLCIFCFW